MAVAVREKFVKLHIENPEENKRPHEAEQPSALKTNAYVCSAQRFEGAVLVEYALGTIATFEGCANLKFHVVDAPPQEMSNFMNVIKDRIPRSADAFSSDNQAIHLYRFDTCEEKISTVIVNVHFPYPPKQSHIIGAIGALCKSAFMDMAPEQSAVNVHHGYRHWRVDSVLLPGEDLCINFKNK